MKLLYVTNIPAPYRQKRFNTMAQIFPRHGIEFEVLYMAKTEPNRQWVIAGESYRYPHVFYAGVHPRVGGFFAHFNPGLLMRLLRNDYDVVIVGGMASPTHWLVPFFIRHGKKQVMSVESNLFSTARKDGMGAWMKRVLLQRAHAYQVTGGPQKEYVRFFNPGMGERPFITLPNLIDEELFVGHVDALRADRASIRSGLGVDGHTQMWVLPARLTDIKGVMPFIEHLEGVEGVVLFLLGDGPQAEAVDRMIEARKLPVRRTGFIQQDRVAAFYAAADLFVLPSLKDPSPLSPIEACAAGLPLLVSSRIGNLEDVLVSGLNGWHYDPVTQPALGREWVRQIAGMSRSELACMGEEARRVYLDRFETNRCIEAYAQNLLHMYATA